MKKAIMFLLSLSLAVLAQKPEVAIGAIGNEPKNFKALKGLSTRLTEAIVNSDKYTAVDRSEEILKQLGKEHKYQRSGAVNVERIKELGEQLAAQYMCIVESSELKAGEYLLSARLVDVETAKIEGMGSELSSLKDTKELMRVAEVLAEKLLSSSSAFPVGNETSGSKDDAETYYNSGEEYFDTGRTRQPTYGQPTYRQPTYKQPSSESIDFNESGEIGWQYIGDMHHFRWSIGLFYNTIGANGDGYEMLIGGIYKWGIMKSIAIGFGLFGGLGLGYSISEDYEDYYDDFENYAMIHELGVELILGRFSLHIAERDFNRIGGGIGVFYGAVWLE